MSYHHVISVRTFLAVVGVIGVFIAPWWVPLVCMLILALRYASWETLFIGLLMDLVWLPGGGFPIPLFTIGGIALVWIFMPLRRQFLIP
jgi:hypothetical protein